jgi:hypothetical protein
MTKQEALQAMKDGKKVTHQLFVDEEFIYIKNEVIYDEKDYPMTGGQIDFWTDRKGDKWLYGWSIFKVEGE